MTDPPSISWPLNRPSARQPWTPPTTDTFQNGHANVSASHTNPTPSLPILETPPSTLHPSNLPSGSKSLSGISLRAHLLGLTLGLSASLTFFLLSSSSPLWRAPFFLSALALFHFLEYYVTATYNPTVASISAFLLSQNGSAYNIAHTLAFTECIVSNTLFPEWRILPHGAQIGVLGIGMATLIVGQVTRSVAMAQAGSNFNHTVQMQKKSGHELVTNGIYGWLRHPSYFGFWWWGLGTQMVLGNGICFMGYTIVLWKFFSDRIESKFTGGTVFPKIF